MTTPDKIEAAAKALYLADGKGERCSPECVDHWEHEDYHTRQPYIRAAEIVLEASE